ncbi:MAG: N-acetyltransferase [Thermoplasmata archaeon]
METLQFEDKWLKQLEAFWVASGDALQTLPIYLKSENYLKDSHVLALENEKIVGSAFLMQFDRHYVILRYLQDHKDCISILLEKLKEYACAHGIKKLCCWLAPCEEDTRKLLLENNFSYEGKYYRMSLHISHSFSMPSNVRALAPPELNPVIQIIIEAFDDAHERELVERTLQDALGNKDSVFLGCFEGALLCGCVLLLLYPNDSTKAYIPIIAVKKELQGKGYGRKLIEGAKAWASANGVSNISLSVRADNTRAVALYTRVGFEKVEEVEIYFVQCL